MRIRLTTILMLVMIAFGVFAPGAITRAQDSVAVTAVRHGENETAQWWHMDGVGFQQSGVVLAYQGNGRILVESRKQAVLTVAGASVTLAPGSVVFVDHVEGQLRVMVLRGNADVNDGKRTVAVNVSQQVVICPVNHPGYFIDDGAYRREPLERFEDANGKTIVRQFYLEQIVYTDPILRTLYQNDAHMKSVIKKMNKTGAILRDLNGTGGYEANQV